MCYSGPNDAAEVTWDIPGDHNVNQFSQNFVFFWRKPWLTSFIFLYLIKSIYFLQETRRRHLTNKMYSGSVSVRTYLFIITYLNITKTFDLVNSKNLLDIYATTAPGFWTLPLLISLKMCLLFLLNKCVNSNLFCYNRYCSLFLE